MNNWWQSRPFFLEAFAAVNLGILGGDVAFAHMANHFEHPAEYIPPVFSVVAFAALIAAFPRSPAHLEGGWRRITGMAVGTASCAVGLAGMFWHLHSQFFELMTLASLVYTAPFVAPLAYTGVGLLILMNRMVARESMEWGRWVLLLCAMGIAGNFGLTLCDHAINGFFHPVEWVPVIISGYAAIFLMVAVFWTPTRAYLDVVAIVLVLNALIGLWGAVLHGTAIFDAPGDTLLEQALYSAPPGAPLLLPNLSLLGFIGWYDVRVKMDGDTNTREAPAPQVN